MLIIENKFSCRSTVRSISWLGPKLVNVEVNLLPNRPQQTNLPSDCAGTRKAPEQRNDHRYFFGAKSNLPRTVPVTDLDFVHLVGVVYFPWRAMQIVGPHGKQ